MDCNNCYRWRWCERICNIAIITIMMRQIWQMLMRNCACCNMSRDIEVRTTVGFRPETLGSRTWEFNDHFCWPPFSEHQTLLMCETNIYVWQGRWERWRVTITILLSSSSMCCNALQCKLCREYERCVIVDHRLCPVDTVHLCVPVHPMMWQMCKMSKKRRSCERCGRKMKRSTR